MEIDTYRGDVNQFISIMWYLANDTMVPVYQTSAGILYDKNDNFDRKEYIYWSFIMDNHI